MANKEPGPRVRELRRALGLSQERLAALSDQERPVISKIETGVNHVTSHALRAALAKGFRLSVEDFSSFVDGEISLEEALQRVRQDPGLRAPSGTGTEG